MKCAFQGNNNRKQKKTPTFCLSHAGVSYFRPEGLSSDSRAFTSLFGMGKGGTCASKTPANKKQKISVFN